MLSLCLSVRLSVRPSVTLVCPFHKRLYEFFSKLVHMLIMVKTNMCQKEFLLESLLWKLWPPPIWVLSKTTGPNLKIFNN